MEAGYLPPQAENNQRSRGGWVPTVWQTVGDREHGPPAAAGQKTMSLQLTCSIELAQAWENAKNKKGSLL